MVDEDGRISVEGRLELPSWPPVRRTLFVEVPAVVVVGHTVSFGTTTAPKVFLASPIVVRDRDPELLL